MGEHKHQEILQLLQFLQEIIPLETIESDIKTHVSPTFTRLRLSRVILRETLDSPTTRLSPIRIKVLVEDLEVPWASGAVGVMLALDYDMKLNFLGFEVLELH